MSIAGRETRGIEDPDRNEQGPDRAHVSSPGRWVAGSLCEVARGAEEEREGGKWAGGRDGGRDGGRGGGRDGQEEDG